MPITFKTTTTHTVNEWSGEHFFRVTCRVDDMGDARFCAVARNFGAGREAATPELAIRTLVHAQGAGVKNIKHADGPDIAELIEKARAHWGRSV